MEAGAYCVPAMGWERVSYIKTSQGQAQGQGEVKDTYGRPAWLGCLGREVEACKTGTGLFDASSMVIVDVQVGEKYCPKEKNYIRCKLSQEGLLL